jgi:hypothetical protein
MALGIIYFITLVILLGKVLIFFKNISEPLGIAQFIFPNSWWLLGIGFKVIISKVLI